VNTQHNNYIPETDHPNNNIKPADTQFNKSQSVDQNTNLRLSSISDQLIRMRENYDIKINSLESTVTSLLDSQAFLKQQLEQALSLISRMQHTQTNTHSTHQPEIATHNASLPNQHPPYHEGNEDKQSEVDQSLHHSGGSEQFNTLKFKSN